MPRPRSSASRKTSCATPCATVRRSPSWPRRTASTPQAVIDALVAEANERIDNAVEDGRIDEAEAAERRAELTERITTLVNEGFPTADCEVPAEADETAPTTTTG